MKKYVLLLGMILSMLLFAGCNKQVIDLNYKYNYAIIQLPNGHVVEGEVQSWKDYEGEQLQVKINGVVYLCSSFNTVLMNK